MRCRCRSQASQASCEASEKDPSTLNVGRRLSRLPAVSARLVGLRQTGQAHHIFPIQTVSPNVQINICITTHSSIKLKTNKGA